MRKSRLSLKLKCMIMGNNPAQSKHERCWCINIFELPSCTSSPLSIKSMQCRFYIVKQIQVLICIRITCCTRCLSSLLCSIVLEWVDKLACWALGRTSSEVFSTATVIRGIKSFFTDTFIRYQLICIGLLASSASLTCKAF